MEIGVGLDARLGLSWEEEKDLAREAAHLGYTSIWTPEGAGIPRPAGLDSFQLCAHRWAASRSVVPGGVTTGIGVSPVIHRSPVAFAMSGGTLSQMTDGRFIMGLGSGNTHQPRMRKSLGMPKLSALAMMRDYLVTTRALLRGERLDHQGPVVTLRGITLGISPPPRTPVYLGALGPEMLRLAGELADGVVLNWCAPQQVAWSLERIAEGAARVGRDPGEVKVAQYIRVCVDEDEETARRAFARATVHYALGPHVPSERERTLGYRAHFERIGFGDALAELDRMRSGGASGEQVADAFPPELLRRVGYYGPLDGAAQAFHRLADGLDIAIVRVVATRPGADSALAAMRACQPGLNG